MNEEAETKYAEDNRRNPGEVIDGDADGTHQRSLFGIFAQVNCRQHAKGRNRKTHQHGHHKGAEECWENAALSIRFARVFTEELPDFPAKPAETLRQ